MIDTEGLYRKGQRDAWVKFECFVAPDGASWPDRFFTFSPGSDHLKSEITKRVRLSKFIPAVYNHRRTSAWFSGTVIFFVVNGQPKIRIYANHEMDEIKRGTDFVSPQVVRVPGKAWPVDAPMGPSAEAHGRAGGTVELRHTVDATGKTLDVRLLSENPPGYKFGENAEKVAPFLDYLPAYRNGQPTGATYTLTFRYGRPRP